jgi:hypothetical protein
MDPLLQRLEKTKGFPLRLPLLSHQHSAECEHDRSVCAQPPTARYNHQRRLWHRDRSIVAAPQPRWDALPTVTGHGQLSTARTVELYVQSRTGDASWRLRLALATTANDLSGVATALALQCPNIRGKVPCLPQMTLPRHASECDHDRRAAPRCKACRELAAEAASVRHYQRQGSITIGLLRPGTCRMLAAEAGQAGPKLARMSGRVLSPSVLKK